MPADLADKIQMQNRLFAELSAMFGREVPLYDRSLAVNRECNSTVCALLAKLHAGFAISSEQMSKTSGERHGAIRIGRPDELRWIARFFAAFAMEPHNFYDMTGLGNKSQPILATAFRSRTRPEHRVFTSLLMTDSFDDATRQRIESLLSTRNVFTPRAKELVERNEKQGGLSEADGNALIREGVDRIFKWTGQARDHKLYTDLCGAGFKIAADIACFESHHLNHLTPNTLCMDLYTAAMKHCLGELDEAAMIARASTALARLERAADRDWMRLHFKHLGRAEIDSFPSARAPAGESERLARALVAALAPTRSAVARLKHDGFSECTEGPPQDTPVLLRQDSYKALAEPVRFREADGSFVDGVHTARFGEIEERFYATTPSGRELYDRCLALADAECDKDPTLSQRDFAAFEALYAKPFAPFPKTLPGLLEQGLVYGLYAATPQGIAAKGSVDSIDMTELVRKGYVHVDGIRYEDFLPVSAAGIFASNLNQQGIKSKVRNKPEYSQAMFEKILGKPVVDTNVTYCGMQAASLLETYAQLGVLDRLDKLHLTRLKATASATLMPSMAADSIPPA